MATLAELRRDAPRLALLIALALALVWAPFVLGLGTLLDSASDTSSLYWSGASPGHDPGAVTLKTWDPGGPGWQSEPWLALSHRLIFDDHVLPMWDPYDGYGTPYAATMQPQPFNPLAFAASIAPGPYTYNLYILARLFLLGLGCALFVRLFAGLPAALTAGICGAFSGYFLMFLDMPYLSVEVLLPWSLLAVEIAIRHPGLRASALLGGFWLWTILGGMPESIALAGVTIVSYAIFRVYLERADRAGVRRIVSLVVGLCAGTLAAGIMLVPFLEMLRSDFDNHQGRFPGLGSDPVRASSLLTEIAPLAIGPPYLGGWGMNDGRGFPGMVALFGASIAFVVALFGYRARMTGDRVALFLVLAAGAFEAKRFGFPLVQWIGGLPIMDVIILVKYEEAVVGVCVACAAGLGFEALLRRRAPQSVVLCVALFWLVTVAVLSVGIAKPAITLGFLYWAIALALLLLLAVTVLAWASTRERLPRQGVWLFAGLALLEGAFAYVVPVFYVVNKPPQMSRNPYAGAQYVSILQDRYGDGRERIFAVGGILYPDWSGAFGLYDVRDMNAMFPERYLRFVNGFLGDAPPYRDGNPSEDRIDRFTGTLPIRLGRPLALRWIELSSIALVVVPSLGLMDPMPVHGSVVPASLPRLRLVHRILPVTGEQAALAALKDPAVDVGRVAVVEGATPSVFGDGGADAIDVDDRGPDRTALTVNADGDALLVQSDTWYPGWRAWLDGREVPLLRTNDLFRGVAVPSGRHSVVIAYRSTAVTLGLILSFAGLAALLALAFGPNIHASATIAATRARQYAIVKRLRS